MLVQCWADVEDDGPTFNQQRFTVSCLLGRIQVFVRIKIHVLYHRLLQKVYVGSLSNSSMENGFLCYFGVCVYQFVIVPRKHLTFTTFYMSTYCVMDEVGLHIPLQRFEG